MPKINITEFRYAGLCHGTPLIQTIEFNGGLTAQFCNCNGLNEIPEGWENQSLETHINEKWLSFQAMPLWMRTILEKRWDVTSTKKKSKKKSKKRPNIVKTLSIEEVKTISENVTYKNGKAYAVIDNFRVSVRRVLYHISLGFNCISCDRKGELYHIWEQKNTKDLHIDLYSSDDMLMTIDHITPKALGGKNEIGNYQIMCAECNNNKGCS